MSDTIRASVPLDYVEDTGFMETDDNAAAAEGAAPETREGEGEVPEESARASAIEALVEKANSATLIVHRLLRMGVEEGKACDFFNALPNAKVLRDIAVTILQNLGDGDDIKIDRTILGSIKKVSPYYINHVLAKRSQIADFFTPINAYSALMSSPFARVVRAEQKIEKDDEGHETVKQISVFQCGNIMYSVDMTSVWTIYATWKDLLAAIKASGSHRIEILDHVPWKKNLAYFAAENIVINPGAALKFINRNKKEYTDLLSAEMQMVEADLIEDILNIVNSVPFSVPYTESDRKTWFYVFFMKMKGEVNTKIEGMRERLATLQLNQAAVLRKIGNIFTEKKKEARQKMVSSMKNEAGDPLYEVMMKQLKASNEFYPQGTVLDAAMVDAFSVAPVMSFPRKTSDMATIASLMLSSAAETASTAIYFWGFPKPDILEILCDMRKSVREGKVLGLAGIEWMEKIELYWVTNIAGGVDIGVTKLSPTEAKKKQLDATNIRALNYIFEAPAFTGIPEKGMNNLMDTLIATTHISYMIRHTHVAATSYVDMLIPILDRQKFNFKLIHHPRLNSAESYLLAFSGTITKQELMNMIMVYCADYCCYTTEFSKLRDRMVIGSQVEKYDINAYLKTVSDKYYKFIPYAQNWAWKYQARKKHEKVTKTTGVTDYGSLVTGDTVREEDYSLGISGIKISSTKHATSSTPPGPGKKASAPPNSTSGTTPSPQSQPQDSGTTGTSSTSGASNVNMDTQRGRSGNSDEEMELDSRGKRKEPPVKRGKSSTRSKK